MHSIQMAMFWEFWRRHRWWVFCFLAVIGGGVAMLWLRLPDIGAGPSVIVHYFTIQLEMVLFLAMAFFRQYNVRKNRLSFPSRLYTHPVRTSVLVAWQMIFPALMVGCLYLATVGAGRIIFSVTWPIVGPLLLLLTFLACMQAIVWITTGFPLLQIGLGVVSYVQFERFISSRYGIANMFNLPRSEWKTLTSIEFLGLLFCIGLAYAIAVIGISRDRRGDCSGWMGLRACFAGLRDMLPRNRRAFSSTAKAQFWMEWRERGWSVPAIIAALCVISVLLGAAMPSQKAVITFWMFLLIFLMSLGGPLFVGLNLGTMGRRFEMTSFRATRPISSLMQSMVVIWTALWSMLMAWAVILLAWLLMIGWFYLVGQSETVTETLTVATGLMKQIGYSKLLGLAGLFPLYLLAAVGIGASLTLMGRTWFLCILCGGSWGVLIIWAILCGLGLIPEWFQTAFSKALPWGIGMTSLVGTIWIFARACQRELIYQRVCLFAGCSWAALFAGMWLLWRYAFAAGLEILWFSKAPQSSSIIMMGGLLTLMVLPLASGPLAVAWNRHR
ncbi:MAG: hypothetical protein FVQ79_04440 [Planctomycetes bacterium]|nr:hypothetical protein [Planctomycetota bacterium]